MKHFVFDLDGVLVISPLFTDNMLREHNVPIKDSLSFIFGEYQDCVVGKKDLKTVLPKYIEKWGLSLSTQELLDFWFSSENHPNQKLIDYIQSLRARGYHCSVATNQEKYRIKYIRTTMKFSQYFDDIFTSSELGVKKPNPAYYQQITSLLNTNPSNITFFDDRPHYAQAAIDVGWDAHTFQSTDKAIKIITNITK